MILIIRFTLIKMVQGPNTAHARGVDMLVAGLPERILPMCSRALLNGKDVPTFDFAAKMKAVEVRIFTLAHLRIHTNTRARTHIYCPCACARFWMGRRCPLLISLLRWKLWKYEYHTYVHTRKYIFIYIYIALMCSRALLNEKKCRLLISLPRWKRWRSHTRAFALARANILTSSCTHVKKKCPDLTVFTHTNSTHALIHIH